MEISKILLDVASDDLEQPDKLRSLLKDLREARQAKSREGLKHLYHSELSVYSSPPPVIVSTTDPFVQLPNLSAMEINEIRPYFVESMSILSKLALPPQPGV